MTRLLLACAAVALLAAACGGSSSTSNTPTPAAQGSPAATAGARTSAAGTTPAAAASPAAAATATQAGATVEVTGIVGIVNTAQNQLNIQHLSGVNVRKINVDSSTSIRMASGGSLTLAQIRPSDRIIAQGKLNDRQDTLLATQVTVEQVVPGAQPGG
jgi:hypothetical protein